MKKFIVALAVVMFAGVVNAQEIKDEIQMSRDRSAKLEALVKDYKACGNANIDGYGDAMKNAAVLAIANSVQLENMYKRQIGEAVDGVQDVTVTKPTLEEWTTFAETVVGEGVSIKTAVDKAQGAADEAKTIAENASKGKNPMAVAKAAKTSKAAAAVVEFGNTATSILLEESAAQAKAVQQIIENVKSGKNL